MKIPSKRTIHHRLIRAKQSINDPGPTRKWIFNPIKQHSIDPDTLHFGQQHVSTVNLFDDPWHTVDISSFPHYKFLLGNYGAYEDYLRESWKYHNKCNTQDNRSERILEFEELLSDIQINGIQTPVEYVTRPNGDRILYHGNHRAAIAHYLGIDLPAVEISTKTFILRNIRQSDAFYGIGHEGIPYQSVYIDGQAILKGRRRDLKERYEHIAQQDLKRKLIVDFGSNIGSSSLLAAEDADYVLGVEYNPKLVTVAIRINTILAKQCDFQSDDLSKPQSYNRSFDTGFCFSLDKHVSDDTMLARNIAATGVDVLYFETHSNSTIPESIRSMANNIDFITSTGTHARRELYRIAIS